jgi:hypothetical protein
MAQLPIKHGEVTKIVTVRMAESDVKLVKAQAKKEGVSTSSFIRQAALASALAGEAYELRILMRDAERVSNDIRRIMSDTKGADFNSEN